MYIIYGCMELRLCIHIPPCPPEGVAVSEDEEGAVGTCPERGEVEMS